MKDSAVQTLRPNVTQAEAIEEFSKQGLGSLFWRARSGPLQRIAGAYVPYAMYEVRYVMARAPQARLFAMDTVAGSLDLFEFPQAPGEKDLLGVYSRNCLQPGLSHESAAELLREKVLRVIFQQGFFKLREASLEIARQPMEFYLPYWLGFYSGGGPVRCRVMDAVRRRIEGYKASAFFEEWLAA